MSVRVLATGASVDWRRAEAAMQESVVEVADDALARLADWETLFGDEEDIGHLCRCLAASLRLARKSHGGRAELLRAASSLLEDVEPLGSRKA